MVKVRRLVSGTIHQWFSVSLLIIKKVFWPDSLESSYSQFVFPLRERALENNK
jgi:hypothetical protein